MAAAGGGTVNASAAGCEAGGSSGGAAGFATAFGSAAGFEACLGPAALGAAAGAPVTAVAAVACGTAGSKTGSTAGAGSAAAGAGASAAAVPAAAAAGIAGKVEAAPPRTGMGPAGISRPAPGSPVAVGGTAAAATADAAAATAAPPAAGDTAGATAATEAVTWGGNVPVQQHKFVCFCKWNVTPSKVQDTNVGCFVVHSGTGKPLHTCQSVCPGICSQLLGAPPCTANACTCGTNVCCGMFYTPSEATSLQQHNLLLCTCSVWYVKVSHVCWQLLFGPKEPARCRSSWLCCCKYMLSSTPARSGCQVL